MHQIALVVDDSRVARMTLSKLLVAHNLKVVELGSGEDALIYLKGDNVKPDIIFMDVMMGGMDGLMATQQIKADDNLKYIPVVVCTGHDTDADRAKSQQAGAVATLTKPPKAEALDAIIAELAQHIAIDPQAETSSLAIDSTELLTKLKALVKQDLLPTMQQELRGLAEMVSRQVANDTAEHRIAEKLDLLSNNQQQPVLDEKRLLANVISTIQQDLLPKMHKDVREMAEDISRQIAADTAEQMVAQQVKLSVDAMLPALKEQLLAQAQRVTVDLANSVAKHAAHDAVANSAVKAVQNAAKESDLPRQIMVMLNTEGQAWLQRHEQQMFEPLIKQVEAKFTPMVMTYLNDHLMQMIAPIARTVVEESLAVTKAQEDAVTNTSNDKLGLEGLSQQVSMLKMLVIGLGCTVSALAVAMIL
ncbi:MAG: response regulator [Pseudomonadota bacterium]|nr:response regulator [Pseudomonadota bacterium]MDO7710092.1 response regulator [Pseudomonadota bacterium]